ncbi:peptidyl-prolyl cis-trans isomerase [bacterium]|nr:peptidyl-prolyl cis-trans isomerase [bacterium]
MRTRNTIFLYFFVLVISIGLVTCKGDRGEDEIIARVGNASLSLADMKRRMEWEGMRPEQESEFVDRWVNRELLYQEAKKLGLDKSESEDLLMELEIVEKEYLIQKLLDRTFAQKIQITEEEIQSYYETNMDLFRVDEDQVKILHILTESKEEANLALQEIRAGKPFDQVAKERSIGIFNEKGGDMGFIKRLDVIPEIERVAFRTAEGRESDIFQSNYGFHIIKVIKKLSKDDVKDIADVRNEILQQLQVRKERFFYTDLVGQLQNNAKVQISVPKNREEVSDTMNVSINP